MSCTCPGCARTFEIPAHLQAAWIACPHCAGRVANLRALRNERRESLSCLGILLGSIGGGLTGLFLLCGYPGTLLVNPWLLGGGLIGPGNPLAATLLWALASGFLFLAGLLCVRAAERAAGRWLKLLAALFALLASAALFLMLTLALTGSR